MINSKILTKSVVSHSLRLYNRPEICLFVDISIDSKLGRHKAEPSTQICILSRISISTNQMVNRNRMSCRKNNKYVRVIIFHGLHVNYICSIRLNMHILYVYSPNCCAIFCMQCESIDTRFNDYAVISVMTFLLFGRFILLHYYVEVYCFSFCLSVNTGEWILLIIMIIDVLCSFECFFFCSALFSSIYRICYCVVWCLRFNFLCMMDDGPIDRHHYCVTNMLIIVMVLWVHQYLCIIL